MFERLGNKFGGFGFELDENVKNKITVDLDHLSKDILKEDKNISKEDLKNKINKSLKDNKTPDYSKNKIFKEHFDEKMNQILKSQEDYLIEEERKKKDEELRRYREYQERYEAQILENARQQETINRMREEERVKNENYQKMKSAFERSQQNIENKHFEESKKYIEKYIANVFLKEFKIEKEKKIQFKISLISYMKNFTQEFMNFCNQFLNFFKSNTDKIILEFDIKQIDPIEHLNMIVIGRAGVGKSSFINESLSLSENKRAKEGIGLSVTHRTNVYTSDKLKMIRMWDTQGLDYKISQKYILNEIKRLVDAGLDRGPDHYINIILYCTSGDRFQNEDGQLIYEIMKLYPLDNLPVVITQLQSYFKKKAKKMEEIIRKILDNYLDHQIVEKIEIKSIVARDFKDEDSDNVYKAYGIPELLRLSSASFS